VDVKEVICRRINRTEELQCCLESGGHPFFLLERDFHVETFVAAVLSGSRSIVSTVEVMFAEKYPPDEGFRIDGKVRGMRYDFGI